MHDSIMHSIGTPRRATASLLMVVGLGGRCVPAYKLRDEYGPSGGAEGSTGGVERKGSATSQALYVASIPRGTAQHMDRWI